MKSLNMTERHALKFSALGITQQQRVMKKLAQQARTYSKDTKKNANSAEADHYDWQRKIRLSREARSIHLIRAFLKGTPYIKVEASNCFHTRPAKLVVLDHMPFTLTTMKEDFSEVFDKWLGGEVDEAIAD